MQANATMQVSATKNRISTIASAAKRARSMSSRLLMLAPFVWLIVSAVECFWHLYLNFDNIAVSVWYGDRVEALIAQLIALVFFQSAACSACAVVIVVHC